MIDLISFITPSHFFKNVVANFAAFKNYNMAHIVYDISDAVRHTHIRACFSFQM